MSLQILAHLPNGTTHAISCDAGCTGRDLASLLQASFGLPSSIYLHDGLRELSATAPVHSVGLAGVQVCLALCGGKGGYGNQLRALGRKGGITDNMGDCRDLSGRRIRDVQAMEEAAQWKATQKERDDEKARLKAQEAEEKARQKEAEAQEVQEQVVKHLQLASSSVDVSVTTGIGKASQAEVERKRRLSERSTLAQKRAKVFGLTDDGDDSASDSDESTGDAPPN